MLSTSNWRHEYKKKGEKRTAKFFPCWDDPYHITDAHPKSLNYTLDIPSNTYPMYHIAQLKQHLANDPILFPNCELPQPGPIITSSGLEEFLIEDIMDSCHHRHSWKFLVRWMGYGPKHDLWVLSGKLSDCQALDLWYQNGGDGPEANMLSTKAEHKCTHG